MRSIGSAVSLLGKNSSPADGINSVVTTRKDERLRPEEKHMLSHLRMRTSSIQWKEVIETQQENLEAILNRVKGENGSSCVSLQNHSFPDQRQLTPGTIRGKGIKLSWLTVPKFARKSLNDHMFMRIFRLLWMTVISHNSKAVVSPQMSYGK